MSLIKPQKLFGTPLRTRALIALNLLEESYPTELARIINSPLFSVQRVLDNLEEEGFVVSVKRGLERRFSLNPKGFAYKEFKGLLSKLAEQDSDLIASVSKLRTRPRRKGKPL